MPVLNVAFEEIPYDWRNTGTYVEVRPNYKRQGLVVFPARGIIATQMLSTGTALPGRVYEITRPEEATVLFGRGSIGQEQFALFKGNNKTSRVYAIAAADLVAGVAASGTITFTGAATASSTVSLYIANRRIRFIVTALMTVTQIAAAAVVAITADLDCQVTATSALGVVTLTARHKGECGNAIDVRIGKFDDEVIPAGLTATVVAMAGGTGNPVLQTLLDVIVNEWYTDIAVPWDDAANLTALSTYLAGQYKALGKLDAHAYVGHRGTYAQLGVKGALTNSPFLSPIGANRSPSTPWAWSAALMANAMFHLTNDPARQIRTVALSGIAGPDSKEQFTDTERDLLLRQGVSTFKVLPDRTVVLDRVITAYKVSNLNVPDIAWLDIMVPKTLTRIRYDWSSYVSLVYPRHKLTDDDSVAANNNDNIATPRRMHGSWASRCKLYEAQGWIQDVKNTVAQSQFGIDATDKNRMNALQQVNIIGNLMVLAAALEFQV